MPRSHGVTLIEMLVGMMILSLVVFFLFTIGNRFSTTTGKTLTERLVLEMEARRAIMNLYQEISQGVEVVIPRPGVTLPYLVFRDSLSTLHTIYLTRDDRLSAVEQRDIFTAVHAIKEDETAPPSRVVPLLRYVRDLRFTTHDFGKVLIVCTMAHGSGNFALVNQVRLKNQTVPDT